MHITHLNGIWTNPLLNFLTYEGTDTQLKLSLEPEDVGKDVFSSPVPTLEDQRPR